MLNKFRGWLDPLLVKIGLIFALKGISANFWTGLGLAVSIVSGIVYAMAASYVGFSSFYVSFTGSILLLIAGFFDIVDGSVARVKKQSSKKGAFLDSVFDKISEVVIFTGIMIGNLAEPIACITALSLSLLVSFIRARSESLGVELKGVGIGERAERILIIGIIGIIPVHRAMQWAVIIVSVLAAITIIQRIITTSRKL